MSLIIKQGPDCGGLKDCADEIELTLGKGRHWVVLCTNVYCIYFPCL